METTRECYNLEQAYFWSKAIVLYQTNCASGYEASEAKSFQEHEEMSKSARDFKIICTQDIKKLFVASCIQ